MSIDIQTSPLRAFHADPAIKARYLKRVDDHRAADELVKGATGEDGKGCAVWCTLDAYDHSRYPIELGIPEWLARVEDTLFEGMSNAKAMTWPRDFLEAISPGVSLDAAKGPFLVVVLSSSLKNFDHQKYPQVLAAVQGAITLWQRDDIGSVDWDAARSVAESAAESVAWSVAESAAESVAESAAESVAWIVAESVAESAAESVAWSVAESAAWSVAESVARSVAYDSFADALLEILRSIKPEPHHVDD